MKVSLTTQLEDTRKMADEESREKSGILGKYRALEHEMDCLREQVSMTSPWQGLFLTSWWRYVDMSRCQAMADLPKFP